MDLKQIEADVIIVIINPDMGSGCVYPMWECDMPIAKVYELAAEMALQQAEMVGGGYTRFEVFDYRNGG